MRAILSIQAFWKLPELKKLMCLRPVPQVMKRTLPCVILSGKDTEPKGRLRELIILEMPGYSIKKFHVDVALNQADILARLIEEEMSMGDMMTLMKLRRGNYSLVEEKIPKGAEAIGIAIKDLKLPEHCVIAAIIRHGEVMIPRGITTLNADDEVLAVTNTKGAEQLAKLFNPPAQG